MNRKSIYLKLLVILLFSTFLVGCSTNSASQIDTGVQSSLIAEENVSTLISDIVTYDNDDYYSDWKNENPNYIELNGTAAQIKGSGVEVKDSRITITKAGVYVLSGKLNNGQIIVDVQDKGIVRLVLNGVEINSADNAPIYVKNAGKTILTLQDGTENFISDGAKYALEAASSDEPNAAIYSKDSITINGNGTATVRGNYNNGITSKDDLKITGGNIKIYATDDGLMGRDAVVVKDGNISIEAGGDGIKSSNDTDASKGFIAIEGGSFDIKSGKDGFQAETSLLINSGTFVITSGGGSTNTSTYTIATEEQSAKAVKASTEIVINGGTFNMDSADDAIHSNGNVAIAGGDITITAGDDGIHADSAIVAEGGKINIAKSYEGIESSIVTIAAGEIYIVASDDGINIAGGNDGSAVNGRPGQNSFSTSSNNKLNISGGYVVVDSTGDGLDSNGSIYMSGGTVLVSGPTANMNGALDYDGVFEISGGFLIAAGSSGMAQVPSEQSTQNSILMYYPQVQQAGVIVNLKDSTGKTIVTFAPKKEYQSVAISSPEIKKNTAYTLYSGGASTGSGNDGLYTDGEYKGGAKIVDFTVSKSVTWMSETGETTAKSFRQGGGKGPGMGERPNRPEKGTPPPMNQ
ncbi:MAG: dockerin type 1 [Clostridiales bacterium GWB2_37_7]|nr:MAG: dockerin type 1 [Clostridiales bacterium GWB2_37_7]